MHDDFPQTPFLLADDPFSATANVLPLELPDALTDSSANVSTPGSPSAHHHWRHSETQSHPPGSPNPSQDRPGFGPLSLTWEHHIHLSASDLADLIWDRYTDSPRNQLRFPTGYTGQLEVAREWFASSHPGRTILPDDSWSPHSCVGDVFEIYLPDRLNGLLEIICHTTNDNWITIEEENAFIPRAVALYFLPILNTLILLPPAPTIPSTPSIRFPNGRLNDPYAWARHVEGTTRLLQHFLGQIGSSWTDLFRSYIIGKELRLGPSPPLLRSTNMFDIITPIMLFALICLPLRDRSISQEESRTTASSHLQQSKAMLLTFKNWQAKSCIPIRHSRRYVRLVFFH